MKNKKLTYLLLALVGVIWGFFFFVLFGGDQDEFIPTATVEIQEQDVKDTILLKPLKLDYSDPFLSWKIVAVGNSFGGASFTNNRPQAKSQLFKSLRLLLLQKLYGQKLSLLEPLIIRKF